MSIHLIHDPCEFTSDSAYPVSRYNSSPPNPVTSSCIFFCSFSIYAVCMLYDAMILWLNNTSNWDGRPTWFPSQLENWSLECYYLSFIQSRLIEKEFSKMHKLLHYQETKKHKNEQPNITASLIKQFCQQLEKSLCFKKINYSLASRVDREK